MYINVPHIIQLLKFGLNFGWTAADGVDEVDDDDELERVVVVAQEAVLGIGFASDPKAAT
jgi:hypothetical protein